MTDRMFDLAIAPLQNGGFQLSQQSSSIDEADTIELHPVQVRWLAERAGLIPQADPTLLDRLHARHVGRLYALQERLDDVRRLYLDEILDHCGSGVEFALHLRALEDLTDEMIADIDTAAPAEPAALPEAVTECHEKSAGISVTSKRGRPAKPDALTPAERQARHRARQGEPATAQQAALI